MSEEERKKKVSNLYFDIFYVDLDSTAELTRGFSRCLVLGQFLMNMSLVSRYLQIPVE